MKAAAHQSEDLKTQLKINKIHDNKTVYPIQINHHSGPINMVIFNESGLLFATCSNDGFVNIYNSIDYSLINSFQIDSKKSAVVFIAFNKTGDKIFGITLDKIFMIDAFRFPEEQIIMLAQRPDFRILDFKLAFGDSSFFLLYRFMFGEDDLKPGQSINDLSIYPMKRLMEAYAPLIHKENELLEFEREKMKTMASLGSEPDVSRPPRNDQIVEMPEPTLHIVPEDSEFTRVAVYLDDNIVYLSKKNSQINKYVLNKSTKTPVSSAQLKSSVINRIEFSTRYEFLIASCNDSINLLDPENLNVVHTLNTKFPVLSGRISPFLYVSDPKYHLIYAGGIAARDQAMKSEGGNEIMIYNFATGKIITKLGGCFGNVNYLDLFKDGSGLVTAGEEGYVRVYRFDLSYYKDKEFQ